MTYIPANVARVPNLLRTNLSLGNISRTQLSLLDVQNQLSTGKEISRPSDDPVRYAGIQVLARRQAQSAQVQRNLSNAAASLGVLDNALSEVNDVALQAKQIALSQVNSISTSSERASQAVIVNQLINGLVKTANREGVSGYVFGGSSPGTPPLQQINGGYQFMAQGNGLLADLGYADTVPITLGPSAGIGSTSARVKGDVDLNPNLTASAKLSTLNGARGLGVSLGTVQFAFNGGPTATVDLAGADTVQDVITKLTNAIRSYETTNSVTVLAGAGVTVNGDRLQINVAAAGSLQISDVGKGITAQDLGIAATFTPASPNGSGVDPTLTWTTPISALAGVTGALGSVRVNHLGRSTVVDLSTATTLQDVKSALESKNVGIRVEIDPSGKGINVLSDVSTSSAMALSIEEVTGNNSTATRLGIRTFAPTTPLSVFNNGKGVQVVDNVTNPASGLVDPELNYDFKITLGNTPTAAVVKVDLRPQDLTNVQTVINRINSEIASQLPGQGLLATDLVAQLADGANGITLVQNNTFTQPVKVEQANNSTAGTQLGLVGGTYNGATSTFVGTDTAKVRTDNLVTYLMDLRDALQTNSVSGIQLAGENIDRIIGLISETRGMVGGFAQRVDFASKIEDDRNAIDTKVRSELEDVDYTSAATRFSLLQTQLSASLQTTARAQSTSLLDFLS
ncbi:MAG TPA: flagellin [Phycisphaerales bacterium]